VLAGCQQREIRLRPTAAAKLAAGERYGSV